LQKETEELLGILELLSVELDEEIFAELELFGVELDEESIAKLELDITKDELL
jgi:hypothetical protein